MNAMLSDVIVLDLSRVLADSYSRMIPGDMGATVIKVEPPMEATIHAVLVHHTSGVRVPTIWDSIETKKA